MSMPTTMSALTQERYGSLDVLSVQQVDVPAPDPTRVLVAVEVAAVNPADVFTALGSPWPVRAGVGLLRPKPGHRVRGYDLAGTVVAIGAEVTGWRVGDRVFGQARGSIAQYAVATPGRLAALPEGVSPQHAAAVVMTGTTALTFLRKRPVGPGDRVLVTGASGGVGSAAVQLAKAEGAHVTAVCSGRNVDAVRGLGADVVVDYEHESYTDLEPGFALVIDNVGAVPMLALERLTAPNGLMIPNSGVRGADGGALARVAKAAWRGGVLRKRIATVVASSGSADLERLGAMLASGRLTPLIDSVHPLDRAVDAMARVATHHASGKVLVAVA